MIVVILASSCEQRGRNSCCPSQPVEVFAHFSVLGRWQGIISLVTVPNDLNGHHSDSCWRHGSMYILGTPNLHERHCRLIQSPPWSAKLVCTANGSPCSEVSILSISSHTWWTIASPITIWWRFHQQTGPMDCFCWEIVTRKLHDLKMGKSLVSGSQIFPTKPIHGFREGWTAPTWGLPRFAVDVPHGVHGSNIRYHGATKGYNIGNFSQMIKLNWHTSVWLHNGAYIQTYIIHDQLFNLDVCNLTIPYTDPFPRRWSGGVQAVSSALKAWYC